MTLVFLPEPKKLKMGKGRLALPQRLSIGIASADLESVAEDLAGILGECELAIAVPGIDDTVTLTLDEACKPEGYRLCIDSKGVCIWGKDAAGIRHGIQTLAQIARQSERRRLPCLEIEDWPDFTVRGVYYDVARGRVPLLERLYQLADGLAAYKVNELQLYIEHTFQFRRHPLIGKGADPLTAEDILRLDRHCRARGIELVPSLASFGHMHTILRHKPYHGLAEDYGCRNYHPESIAANPALAHGAIAQSLAPANPRVYTFLDELFGEFLPCFSSKKFNVCCDETADLGLGQSHALAGRIGKGNLYLGHIRKLNEIAGRYGKRIQFWGDIIRHYPELIKDIPKDVTVLDWGYDSSMNFDRIRDFTDTGLATYGCPSVSAFVTLFPRVPEARGNIAGWAKAGVKHGASGILNTDWGDGGHYNFMEYSWIGYLFGAEQSWNHRADQASFTARFCTLFLGIDDPAFSAALDELGDLSHLRSGHLYQSVWLHLFFAKPDDGLFIQRASDCEVSEHNVISRRIMPFDAELGRETLRRLARIRAVFSKQARRKDGDRRGILPYWIFAVDATIHAARKLTVFGRGGRNTPAARNRIRAEMKALMKRFEALWMARNRRSEIAVTLNRYKETLAALDRKPRTDPWTHVVDRLMLSRIMPRPGSGVGGAACVSMAQKLGWEKVDATGGGGQYGFLNAHARTGEANGLVYLAGKAIAPRAGRWTAVVGHDGGIKVFVDGAELFRAPERINPCMPERSRFDLELTKGEHEIVIAFDLDHGNGWGIYFRLEIPAGERTATARGSFPRWVENEGVA